MFGGDRGAFTRNGEEAMGAAGFDFFCYLKAGVVNVSVMGWMEVFP